MKITKLGHCLSVIVVICLSMMSLPSLLHGDQPAESLLLRSVYPDDDLGGLEL